MKEILEIRDKVVNGEISSDEGFWQMLALVVDNEPLPLKLDNSPKPLNKGDIFLWRSGMNGRYEIHTFHSDAGYGAKTFTQYNEEDGSSVLVNYSGICGVLVTNEIV